MGVGKVPELTEGAASEREGNHERQPPKTSLQGASRTKGPQTGRSRDLVPPTNIKHRPRFPINNQAY